MMQRHSIRGALVLAAVVGSSWALPGHAFVAYIDQFTVTKNGAAFFTDDFSNGIAPTAPTSPAGNGFFANGTTPANYSVLGSPGPESGGKLAMDSDLGAFSPASDGSTRYRNLVTLQTDTNNLDTTLGLKSNHTFSVTGLFDLVVPSYARSTYGIALLNTFGGSPGNPANGQVWSVAVGKDGAGQDRVSLIRQDYTANTAPQQMAFAALDLTGTYEQIEVKFDRDNTGNNLAHASFRYFDADTNADTNSFSGYTALGDASLFSDGQLWERAQFFTSQVVPVPATALLFAAGLGLMGFGRRRT
jgi:hypothetical protein